MSLAGTGEYLAIRNPGSIRSSDGTAAVLEELLPHVQKRGGKILVRGDSDFDRGDIRAACERQGAHFAFVGREFTNRPKLVETIDESQWRPFRTRAHRARVERRQHAAYRPRRRKPNRRHARARARNFKELRLVKQWLVELPQTDATTGTPYRLVIRRQRIEHHQGQQHLFDEYRYRYIVTDLPASVTTQNVVDLTEPLGPRAPCTGSVRRRRSRHRQATTTLAHGDFTRRTSTLRRRSSAPAGRPSSGTARRTVGTSRSSPHVCLQT